MPRKTSKEYSRLGNLDSIIRLSFSKDSKKKAGQINDLLKYQIKPLLTNANKKNLYTAIF